MSEERNNINEVVFTRKKRLHSLDVMRGLTVILMIFVDNIGATWPILDHCPWNGIHLADFVMPFFDFMVGLSVTFSLKKYIKNNDIKTGFQKSTKRFLKLFLIGVFTQGGIDIFDYDMKHIRIMGILQRVALCYYFAVILELFIHPWPNYNQNKHKDGDDQSINDNIIKTYQQRVQHKQLPLISPSIESNNDMNGNHKSSDFNKIRRRLRKTMRLFSAYSLHWLAFLLLITVWLCIMYLVNVPNQYGQICGRGVLTPACNAQGYIDLKILTKDHMYFPENGGEPQHNDVTFQRLKACSTCAPGKCMKTKGVDAPDWCYDAAFDPEGLISSITCILTPVFGMHCGHLIQNFTNDIVRVLHLIVFGVIQLCFGLVLHFTKIDHMNTDLYSPSFLFVTGGTACVLLSLLYFVMDMRISKYRDGNAYIYGFMSLFWNTLDWVVLYPLECVGRNALAMYILAESGIVNWMFYIFYWGERDRNLSNVFWPTGVYWGPNDDNAATEWEYSWEIMCWVLGYCLFWTLLAMYLHKQQFYYVI